ncbi:MAG: hypothetical protein AABX01_01865 [Candidatus Micrarchaeota archaeon]
MSLNKIRSFALLLLILASFSAADLSCSFAPAQYSAFAGVEINITVKLIDEDNKTQSVAIDCGTGIIAGGPGLGPPEQTPTPINFTCAYPQAGQYNVTGWIIIKTGGETKSCTNNATVQVMAAPAISQITEGNQTLASIDISWLTDQPANSSISFGITDRAGIGSAELRVHHSLKLANLQEGKTYNYIIESCNIAGCTSSVTRAFMLVNICTVQNACETSPNGPLYRKYSLNETASCELKQTDTCTAGAGGCCEATCANDKGCLTTARANACVDICIEATRKTLKIIGVCTGCGISNAKGECGYSQRVCDAASKCKSTSDSISCGGAAYYCIEENGNFVWSQNAASCIPASTPVATISSGGGGSGSGGGSGTGATPTPTQSMPPGNLDSGHVPIPFLGETNPADSLIGIVDNETIEIIKKSPNKESYNLIQVVSHQFDPELIREGARVLLIATTDSESPLKTPRCYPAPADPRKAIAADCSCSENLGGNFSRFRCDIIPKFPKLLAGSYTIELSNALGQSGFQTIELPIGKSAKLTRLTVKSGRNELLFYGAIFAGMMLISYALFHVLSKFEKAAKAGEILRQQKQKVLSDMETLKFHYLKRGIDYATYNMAMIQKQKELTEINTRIAESQSGKGGKMEAPSDSNAWEGKKQASGISGKTDLPDAGNSAPNQS